MTEKTKINKILSFLKEKGYINIPHLKQKLLGTEIHNLYNKDEKIHLVATIKYTPRNIRKAFKYEVEKING